MYKLTYFVYNIHINICSFTLVFTVCHIAVAKSFTRNTLRKDRLCWLTDNGNILPHVNKHCSRNEKPTDVIYFNSRQEAANRKMGQT